MRFIKFKIVNFKGIKNAELKLDQLGQGKIFTLVGLNESGKTTVLEAINSFSPDLAAQPIFQNDIFRRVEPKDLVPKHLKDNFTGDVSIEAFLEFSDQDIKSISDYFEREHALNIDVDRLGKSFHVQKTFKFKQSDHTEQTSYWWISLAVKTKRAKKYNLLSSRDDVWQAAVVYIRSLIPKICYFPTFLFEFPFRVYLSHAPEQYEPQNTYYCQIIQDVLDSLDRGLTIEEHIVSRVEKIEDGEAWSFFDFFKSDRKEQVDAVMSHLANQISKSVFTRWNEIFGSKFPKNIKIEWNVDGHEQNPPVYLSFSVQDGTSTYSIAERSLGFRWFFCFLLFTQFRKSRRDSGTLFLLDEPASNLHATAQQQLLASFEAVTGGNNSLIYSTHSHYMINPRWIEGAFIVQNGAIEYDDELTSKYEFHAHETDIIVSPYRRFVGENPDKSTYYQPILDALDYSPSVLEHQSNAVMVEGKSDFYLFAYFQEIFFPDFKNLRFLPSSGSNEIGPLISLYLGWGYDFIVLLDDDKSGKQARSRYIEEWYLNDKTVITLADLSPKLKGKKLESLISSDGKDLIKKDMGLKRLSKKHVARFFQNKLARREEFSFDEATVDNLKAVMSGLSARIGENSA
ncbi:MAG: AAA family ATPase [Thermodesulfobacteriota bacterium]